MGLARVKTWVANEVLTAADLNGEFNNILNNPINLVSPTTGAINFQTSVAHTNLIPTAISGSSGVAGSVFVQSTAGTQASVWTSALTVTGSGITVLGSMSAGSSGLVVSAAGVVAVGTVLTSLANVGDLLLLNNSALRVSNGTSAVGVNVLSLTTANDLTLGNGVANFVNIGQGWLAIGTTAAGPASGDILLANNKSIRFLNGAGAQANILSLGTTDRLAVGIGSTAIYLKATDVMYVTSSQISVTTGVAASPGYAFTNDSNTGLYGQAADTLGFAAGGIQVGAWSTNQLTVVATGGRPTPQYSFSTNSNYGMLNNAGVLELIVTANPSVLLSTSTVTIQPQSMTGQASLTATTSSLKLAGAGGGSVIATLITGMQIGTPTSSDAGAGTLNVSGDLFKNGTAYNNPDYVLEHWAKGRIEVHSCSPGAKQYRGLKPLHVVEEHCKGKFTLPLITQVRQSSEGVGLFNGGDAILASLEEAYLYIFQLHDRITALESKAKV